MTPDQISGLTAVAAIISKMGTWPIGSIVGAIVFGPWIVMGIVTRGMEKRHESALKMYEENVKLVVHYEKIVDEQADTIRLSTAATTELITYLKMRPPCYERIQSGGR